MRLVALLIQSHLLAEAGTTVALEGDPPPAEVSDAADRLADAIQSGAAPPAIPPPWRSSPGAESLSDALAGSARLLTTDRIPAAQQRLSRPGPRERLDDAIDNVRSGRLIRLSAARLMVCVGVAAVMSEILPLQRSYWVVLTVAIVMKPDFGSVFTRAIQRGLGTVVGAAGGAVIVAAVPYGPLLLIPVAVFAGLLPYGRSRNYGLMSVFLTPLVVLLIDLPNHTGWHLAEARLIDTLLGCGIALVIGYAPWPDRLDRPPARRSSPTPCRASAITWSRPWWSGHRTGTGCAAGPTEPCPTCGPSSSARCPSHPPPAAAPPRGGPPWWGWSRSWTRSRPRPWLPIMALPSRNLTMSTSWKPCSATWRRQCNPGTPCRPGTRLQEPGGLPADQRLSPITDAVQRVQAVLAG